MNRLLKDSKVYLILTIISLVLFYSPQLKAQNLGATSSAFGICATYNNVPEDADFKDTGGNGEIDKFELFLDIGNLRLAVNAIHGLHKNRTPETVLSSNSGYLAYRFMAYDNNSKLDAYLMGGIALVASTLSEGESTLYTSDDYGYILGTGVLYYFREKLGLGVQLLRISAAGNLGGETIETGSDQVQMVFKYPF